MIFYEAEIRKDLNLHVNFLEGESWVPLVLLNRCYPWSLRLVCMPSLCSVPLHLCSHLQIYNNGVSVLHLVTVLKGEMLLVHCRVLQGLSRCLGTPKTKQKKNNTFIILIDFHTHIPAYN